METVCQICGDIGFVEALIHCVACRIVFVHRYCLDTTPVLFVEDITWFCEECDGAESSSDSKKVYQTSKKSEKEKKKEKENEEEAEEEEEEEEEKEEEIETDLAVDEDATHC